MKYEYLVAEPSDYCDPEDVKNKNSHFWKWPDVIDVLNRYGNDGWQLCFIGQSTYYFKRQVKE